MANSTKKNQTSRLTEIFSFFWQIAKNIFQHFFKNRRWYLPIIAYFLLKYYAPSTLFIIFLSMIFYIIFYPLIIRMEKIVKSNRASVLILTILIALVILLMSIYLFPALINQVIEFTKNYPQIEKFITEKMKIIQENFRIFQSGLFKAADVSINDMISRYLHSWAQAMINFFDTIVQSLSRIVARVIHVLVAFCISIYLLFESKRFVKAIKYFYENNTSEKEQSFIKQAYQQIMSYFSGITLLALIGFIAALVFLNVIQIKFSLLLDIWTGIMEFIPFFGPLIAAIPIILIAWAQKPILVLYVFIFFIILQTVLGYILAPQVLGKKTHFHPLIVFFILIIGGETYGIPGMLFSLPIVSVLYIFYSVYLKDIK
jgi:predicted PurR-regulated permease PerM